MRSINELLDDMSPEMRIQAEMAIFDAKEIASVLATVPSPSALAGQPLDRDDDFLDERYGDNDEN